MAELKTKPTTQSVEDYLNSVENEERRADARTVIALFETCTGEKPVMWGPSIIGFGSYKYKYASGHQGEAPRMGLSARKPSLVLYGVIFYSQNTELLDKLGKYKQGKGCLYITRLSDVDMGVLERMIRTAHSAPSPSEV